MSGYSSSPTSDERVRLLALSNTAYLTDRERAVLMLRYGPDGHVQQTFMEIARRFGVTGERIRQLEQRAFRRLRRLAPPDPDTAEQEDVR